MTSSIKILFVSFVGCCVVATVTTAAEPEADIVGEAFRLGSQELLYREFHYQGEANRHSVIYRSSNGEELAVKKLHYGERVMQPSYEQVNHWCGEKIEVQVDEGEVEIRYRDCGRDTEEAKTLSAPEPLVIDAGFDRYVRQQWDALLAGNTITFHYLAPSQLRTIRFAAAQIQCEEAADNARCFTIKPDVWWLKWVLDPIKLTYDKDSRRLLRFRGLGNIADPSGDYLNVDIRYRYR